MKNAFFLLITLPVTIFATSGVSVIQNDKGLWDVYYTAPSGKKFFIYEANYQVDKASIDGGDLFYQIRGDIFSILYNCIGNHADSCIRYINIKTNEISRPFEYPALMTRGPYYDLIGPIDNLNQYTLLTFQYPTSDIYIVIPIFQPCKHPFVYKLQHLSDGPGPGSKFLQNGNLYLNMIMDAYGYQPVTISINYKELYENCQSNT